MTLRSEITTGGARGPLWDTEDPTLICCTRASAPTGVSLRPLWGCSAWGRAYLVSVRGYIWRGLGVAQVVAQLDSVVCTRWPCSCGVLWSQVFRTACGVVLGVPGAQQTTVLAAVALGLLARLAFFSDNTFSVCFHSSPEPSHGKNRTDLLGCCLFIKG